MLREDLGKVFCCRTGRWLDTARAWRVHAGLIWAWDQLGVDRTVFEKISRSSLRSLRSRRFRPGPSPFVPLPPPRTRK